jgi:hypothetical protein
MRNSPSVEAMPAGAGARHDALRNTHYYSRSMFRYATKP